MHSKDSISSKCKINKISEVSKEKLSPFYKKLYPERYKSLTENWNWWYRVNKGSIFINRSDITQIPLSVLRRNIGVVLQDTFFLADSLLNNIKFFKIIFSFNVGLFILIKRYNNSIIR